MGILLDLNNFVSFFILLILEIIFEIDNLVFILILVKKLDPSLQKQAYVIGLLISLIMRLGLLSIISWLLNFKYSIVINNWINFSSRDLVFMFGGFFLLIKTIIELYSCFQKRISHKDNDIVSDISSNFGFIVAQIIVIDATFSLDSVITAISIVDNVVIIMISTTVTIVCMLFAHNKLSKLVNENPNLTILCLIFLFIIGITLILESIGYKIPNIYLLYISFIFLIIVERLNSLKKFNTIKNSLIHSVLKISYFQKITSLKRKNQQFSKKINN
ncbi:MAG: TerC family protein [Bordetella sp.]|nr:MAG: TerC family protein [Bordetella sp.]